MSALAKVLAGLMDRIQALDGANGASVLDFESVPCTCTDGLILQPRVKRLFLALRWMDETLVFCDDLGLCILTTKSNLTG